jgi:hypothetical protein
MELLLYPFKVLRRSFGSLLVPALPIVVLLGFILFFSGGVEDSSELLEKTDTYLGGSIYLSAANLTAYNEVSANIQLPLIRLGGIAESTNITEPLAGNYMNFMLAFVVLFLGFMSYAMVSRAVHSLRGDEPSSFGLSGINGPTIVISIAATLLMLFFSSFYLGGLRLLVIISFGIYITFTMPYASTGMPLGESIYRGFKFVSANMGRVVVAYIGSMGAAIMVPIGLLIFTTPLIVNLPQEQETVGNLLKITLGLFSIVIALFYQMALCASVVFDKEDNIPKPN